MSISQDFENETDRMRHELLRHCYQMIGSVHDAEELVQETMLRAWRARDQYDYTRASLRTWLYRIATNVCLSALRGRKRRPLPSGHGPAWIDPEAALVSNIEVPWIQPFPDALETRGSLRLAVVAAMQFLPARQRAILILRDVLEFPAAEVAAILDMTTVAVNSGLQRARTRLHEVAADEQSIDEPTEAERRDLVDRYVEAFEKADIAGLKRLLTDDAVLEMPPVINWFVGREAYGAFIARALAMNGTGWRMLPTMANGHPGIAAYLHHDESIYRIHSLQVITVKRSGIARNTTFYNDPALFATFALPPELTLPADQGPFSERVVLLRRSDLS